MILDKKSRKGYLVLGIELNAEHYRRIKLFSKKLYSLGIRNAKGKELSVKAVCESTLSQFVDEQCPILLDKEML